MGAAAAESRSAGRSVCWVTMLVAPAMAIVDVIALGQHPNRDAELLGGRDDDGAIGLGQWIEIEQHGRVLWWEVGRVGRATRCLLVIGKDR